MHKAHVVNYYNEGITSTARHNKIIIAELAVLIITASIDNYNVLIHN